MLLQWPTHLWEDLSGGIYAQWGPQGYHWAPRVLNKNLSARNRPLLQFTAMEGDEEGELKIWNSPVPTVVQ